MNKPQAGLRFIAIMEAVKGGIALLIILELHALMGQNVEQLAEKLFSHLHLNPASHYTSMVLHGLADINSTKLAIVIMAGLFYSLIRFVEAYGLWHQYRWTEWLALISSAIYLPFELYEFYQKTDSLSFLLLIINTSVVIYLAAILKKAKGVE